MMGRAVSLTLVSFALLASSASAAGEWGYFAVSTANGQAGIVLVAPGQRPGQVAGSAVSSWVYLGPSSTPSARMVRYLQAFASQKAAGFFEYPGGLRAMISDAKSRANNGDTGALVWLKSTPGNAQWDSTPTAIGVSAVAFAAAPTAIGAIEAGGSGAGVTGGVSVGAAGGAAGKVAGKAKSLVSSGSSASGAPADGTPAAALSTSGMAGLAIVALEFDRHYLTAATKASVVSGALPGLYRAITDVAFGLGAIALLALCLSVLFVPWADGALGALAAGLGRLGGAVVLIALVPVVTMLALALVDGVCGALWSAVPTVSTLFNGLVATIAALAGSSVVAHLTHYATIAHVTGTGAWFVSLGAVIGAGLIALEMLAREVGILLSVAFVPLAAIGSVWTAASGWAPTVLKLLAAIVVSKVILVLTLVVGAAFVSAGIGSVAVMSLVLGLVILVLGVVAPFMLYQAFGHVSHSWHGAGLASVGSGSMSMAAHARAAHARVRYREPVEVT